MALGFACVTPVSLFAEDQNPNKPDKKDAGDARHGKKVATQTAVTPQFSKQQGGKPQEKFNNNKFVTGQQTNIARQKTIVNQQNVQQTAHHQSEHVQTQNFAVQGTRSNHYGGRWVAANVHSDWDQHSEHYWNNHRYRWYDGGWIIIDAGPSVAVFRSGSIGSTVQERLAQQGYYNGPIDGDIGPGSRHAIANYQADHGLPVNGSIDEPLLVSLGLQ